MSKDLYQYSIDQLAANQGCWPEIAKECEVSYSWLCKFAAKKIPDASYNRVKRLAENLEYRAKRAEIENRRSTDKRFP